MGHGLVTQRVGQVIKKSGEEWIKRPFDPQRRVKVNGKTRVLVLDGQGSHVSAGFIGFCLENNIILLPMPPYSSRLCRTRLGKFSALKQAMSVGMEKIMRSDILASRSLDGLTHIGMGA